jgi:hypothetical protein
LINYHSVASQIKVISLGSYEHRAIGAPLELVIYMKNTHPKNMPLICPLKRGLPLENIGLLISNAKAMCER